VLFQYNTHHVKVQVSMSHNEAPVTKYTTVNIKTSYISSMSSGEIISKYVMLCNLAT